VDQGFEHTELGQALFAQGHQLTATDEIGAATGIFVKPDGTAIAVAEPLRRGGGNALALP